jgi:CheY-like chemotaxis protein
MSCSILVVDDDTDARETIRDVLEDEGFRVVTAINGKDALDKLETLEPCVILLDLLMPVMTGTQFMEALPASKGAGSPVVIVSAYDTLAVSLNARGFIRKPVELDDLIQTVRKFC